MFDIKTDAKIEFQEKQGEIVSRGVVISTVHMSQMKYALVKLSDGRCFYQPATKLRPEGFFTTVEKNNPNHTFKNR
jgi:hypothetical protein